MATCEVVDCGLPENRDGVCLKHKLGSVGWLGSNRLEQERLGGYSQGELKKEIFETAKADGKDIRQVRGRRGATQKFVNGAWV